MNQINSICRDLLSSRGFVFKRGGWYAISHDFIFIVYFQRSMFSNLYYLNLGVDVNTEHIESFSKDYSFPTEPDFGLRHRVTDESHLLSIDNLSLEKECEIKSFVSEALRFFDYFSSVSSFAEAYINRKIKVFPNVIFLTQLRLINEEEAHRIIKWVKERPKQ